MGGHASGLFYGTTGAPQTNMDSALTGEESGTPTNTHGNPTGDALASQATQSDTISIINELYRPGAAIGDGGTADAIRLELLTGTAVGGRSHISKGKERLRQIEKILEKNPNHPDRALLEMLRDDLKDALGGA